MAVISYALYHYPFVFTHYLHIHLASSSFCILFRISHCKLICMSIVITYRTSFDVRVHNPDTAQK